MHCTRKPLDDNSNKSFYWAAAMWTLLCKHLVTTAEAVTECPELVLPVKGVASCRCEQGYGKALHSFLKPGSDLDWPGSW